MQIIDACPKLTSFKMNGCDVSSSLVEHMAKHLKLEALHVRMSRTLRDDGLFALSDYCKDTLRSVDITRCVHVSSDGVMAILSNCINLQRCFVACGMKRGSWMWGIDDDMAIKMLALQKLKYLSFVDVEGACAKHLKGQLFARQGLEIQKVSAKRQFSRAVRTPEGFNVTFEVWIDGKLTFSKLFKR